MVPERSYRERDVNHLVVPKAFAARQGKSMKSSKNTKALAGGRYGRKSFGQCCTAFKAGVGATTKNRYGTCAAPARKNYEKDEVLLLSERGTKALLKAIETPPEPSSALLKAAELHKKLVKS